MPRTTNSPAVNLSLPGKTFFSFLLALPLIAVYAPKGVVTLVVVSTAALLAHRPLRAALRARPLPLVAAAFLPLALWASASTAWAPNPLSSLGLMGSLYGLLFCGLVIVKGALILEESEKPRMLNAMTYSAGLFILFLGIEAFSGGEGLRLLKGYGPGNDHLSYMNSGAAILAIIACPYAVSIARRFNVAAGAVFLAVVLAVMLKTIFFTPVLALSVAVLVFLFVRFWCRWAPGVISGLIALYTMSFPFVFRFLDSYEDLLVGWGVRWLSIYHRQSIWQFVAERISEHPLLGWGLDASRSIPGGHALVSGRADYSEVLPLHPHNAVLQIWLELGAVGAVAFVVLMLAVPVSLRKSGFTPLLTATFFASFMAYMSFGQLSFGIWQNWWLATCIILVAFSVLAVGERGEES